jgi:hypothetical protein
MLSPAQHVAVIVIALLAGMANSIAGGGTLLTFPALIGLGIPSLMANATSTVALWPGGIASMVGYRAELSSAREWAKYFILPSVLGGLTGGILLTVTSQRLFDAIVPYLVLFATVLFLLQQPVVSAVRRWSGEHKEAGDPLLRRPSSGFLVFHFFSAVYGGYFGAGAGMVILAGLALMGLTNIHQMNGLKNFFAMLFNLVAMITFIIKGLVNWPVAITMMIGSIAGGSIASRLAQRVPQTWVRAAVGVIGFASAGWLFFARL